MVGNTSNTRFWRSSHLSGLRSSTHIVVVYRRAMLTFLFHSEEHLTEEGLLHLLGYKPGMKRT